MNSITQKQRNIKNSSLLAIALLGAVSATGCTTLMIAGAAGAGAATVAYVQGDLELEVDSSAQNARRAAEQTLKSMEIEIRDSGSTGQTATVIGRTWDDRKVTIIAEPNDTGLLGISVRVGTFGDEKLSYDIGDGILDRLKQVS